MEQELEFRAQDMETMKRTMVKSAKIQNIMEHTCDDVLCFGQLKTLFGEPLYITKDLEDQYAYCILAAAEGKKEIYLQVYCGASGASIGGQQDQDSKAAADELAERIICAKAADYDYEGYYLDGPCVVKQGIRNGIPYMEEEELILSEEEFIRIRQEIYGPEK